MLIKSLLGAAGLAAAMAIGTTGATAETLKLATVAPTKSIWAQQVQRFADAVNEQDVDLTIEVYANAELGNQADTLKNTLAGRVDIWIGALTVASAVTPELGVFTLPYLFNDEDRTKCAVPKLRDATRAVAGKKYHFLQFAIVDTQDIFSTEPVRVPSDLKGMKVRSAPVPSSMNFFRSLGATPQAIPAAESTAALNTGLVDVVDFSPTYALLVGAFKVANKYTQTSHNTNVAGYIVGPRSWAKLNDAQKAALEKAAETVAFPIVWDEVMTFDAAMEAKLAKAGVEKLELTDDEKQKWQDAGKATWEETLAGMRGDAKGFLATVEEARQSCN